MGSNEPSLNDRFFLSCDINLPLTVRIDGLDGEYPASSASGTPRGVARNHNLDSSVFAFLCPVSSALTSATIITFLSFCAEDLDRELTADSANSGTRLHSSLFVLLCSHFQKFEYYNPDIRLFVIWPVLDDSRPVPELYVECVLYLDGIKFGLPTRTRQVFSSLLRELRLCSPNIVHIGMFHGAPNTRKKHA